MPIKHILVPVVSTNQAQASLTMAFKVAKRYGAHITALHLTTNPDFAVPAVIPAMPTDYIVKTTESVRKAAAGHAVGLRRIFESCCADHQIAVFSDMGLDDRTGASWQVREGQVPQDYARAARIADLIVLRRPYDDNEMGERELLETVLLESGRPVLLTTRDPSADLSGPAIVGWNGSAEAAKALASAMPFLQQASAVTVVSVGENDDPWPDSESAAQFLKGHNINASAKSLNLESTPVAHVLLEECRKSKAGLMVIGAYSRSRWRELILGGVTRYLIQHADVPVLLMH